MEGRMNMSEFWKNINTYYKRYGLHATIVRIMENKADKTGAQNTARNNISIYAGDFGNCAGE